MFKFYDFPKAATAFLLVLTFLMFVARPMADVFSPKTSPIAMSDSAQDASHSATVAQRVSEIPSALPN